MGGMASPLHGARTPAPSLALPLLLLLALTLALSLPSASAHPGEIHLDGYANNATLEEGAVYFYWTYNDTAKSLDMAVKAKTTGWVAIGISEVGAMVGSDVWLGWVADGRAYITDRFIFNRSLDGSGVALDRQQDVAISEGMEGYDEQTQATWTTLTFSRALNTSDCNDRVIRAGDHVSLIWAMGTDDVVAYHGQNKGAATLQLVPGDLFSIYGPQGLPAGTGVDGGAPVVTTTSRSLLGPADVSRRGGDDVSRKGLRELQRAAAVTGGADGGVTKKVYAGATVSQSDGFFNVSVNGYNIPTNYTTYACNAFSIDFPEKKHVIAYGANINSTDVSSMHHMLVYACRSSDMPSTASNYECTGNIGCYLAYGLWALGSTGAVMPMEAGLPAGAGSYDKFVLQIHYTNPAGKSNIVDSSGMWFKLAPHLRKYDAGYLITGPADQNKLIRIPPQVPAWTQESWCPSECTQKLANTSEGLGTNVTVFSSCLHMHQTGRQLFTEVYRGGKFLFDIHRQDYYDFAFQQCKQLDPGFYLLPGDELKTRCVWDTTNSNETVVGGFASNQEMCLDFLLYYPVRQVLQGPCFSFCSPPLGPAAAGQGAGAGATNMLMPYAVCGTGPDTTALGTGLDIVPINKTCPPLLDFYGDATVPFEAAAGCPADSASSFADVAVGLGQISVPALAGEAAPPGVPSPFPACSATSANGMTLTYDQCTDLDGGFTIMWKASTDSAPPSSVSSKADSNPSPAPNVTATIRFSGTSDGFIAFGFSPSGGMVGSSAFAAWTSPSPMAEAVFLGGKSPQLVTQGNAFQVLNISSEALANAAQNIALYVTLSMPQDMASSTQHVIWSKGIVVNNMLAGHTPDNAHQGSLLAVACSNGICSSTNLPSDTLTPPSAPPAKGAPQVARLGLASAAAGALALLALLVLAAF